MRSGQVSYLPTSLGTIFLPPSSIASLDHPSQTGLSPARHGVTGFQSHLCHSLEPAALGMFPSHPPPMPPGVSVSSSVL